MENIASTIKLFDFGDNLESIMNKFMPTIAMLNYSDTSEIINYLSQKGIFIQKGSFIKVCLNGLDIVKERVEQYESIGELDAIRMDPNRINNSKTFDRLKFLKENSLEYKNEKGKYLPCIDNGIEFKKYVDVYKQELLKPLMEAPKEEKVETLVEQPLEIKEEKIIKEPVQMAETSNEEDKYTSFINDIAEDLDFSNEEISYELVDDNNDIDLVDEILNSEQKNGLTDENTEEWDRLYTALQNVMIEMYNSKDLADDVITNLTKLVTSGIELSEDEKIIRALTFGRIIDSTVVDAIREKLKEQLGIEANVRGVK